MKLCISSYLLIVIIRANDNVKSTLSIVVNSKILRNRVIYSGREYENLIMDCCQMEDSGHAVKREETGGGDPENGSPDADRGGN